MEIPLTLRGMIAILALFFGVSNQGFAYELQLKSDYQFHPVRLELDGETVEVRSIVVTGEVSDDGAGSGTLTLDLRQGLANEFGDIVAHGLGRVIEVPFSLQERDEPADDRLVGSRPKLGRNRFDLAFPEHDLDLEFGLVVGEASLLPHVLLIGEPADPRGFRGGGGVHYFIKLGGFPARTSVIASEPIGDSVRLSGWYTNGRLELRQLSLATDFSGSGQLTLNPNGFGVTALGDMGFMTAMGYQPVDVRVVPVDLEDPLDRGRKLFRIISDDPRNRNEAALVLGPMNDSADHRLLIYRNDQIWTSVRIHDSAWKAALVRAHQAQALSSPEQRALKVLEQQMKGKFTMRPEAGHIVDLTLRFTDEIGAINGIWKDLPFLRSLNIDSCDLRNGALNRIGRLGQLQYFGASTCQLDSQALQAITRIESLTHLTLRNSLGLDDEHLGSMANLGRLQGLHVENDSVFGESGWKEKSFTNDALLRLELPPSLRSVNFLGQNLSDASLVELAKLPELTELRISGPSITSGGVLELKKRTTLKFLQLIQTGVSESEIESLKQALPRVEIEHRNPKLREPTPKFE